MTSFATTTPITAVLDIPAGRIQIIAADRTDATVDIRPATPGKTRDTTAADQTTTTYTDGVLHITTPVRNRALSTGAVEVTLQLPAGSHLQAKTASTELRVVGRLGTLHYTGAHQSIKIDEAAAVHLTAVDGDITIGRLGGDSDITTAHGAIRIDEATHGTLVLRTQAGDITIGAAAGASASLDAATTLGRVSNSLRNNGTTDLAIQATTAHGDITARSL